MRTLERRRLTDLFPAAQVVSGRLESRTTSPDCQFWSVSPLLYPLILREINPEHSLEGMMLKLKLQHFGHLMGRADSLEKTLMLGKIEGRRSGQQRRWLDGIINSVDMLLLLLSRFSHVQLCATPEMTAHQAPPSLGFSRQEHWSGLPFPSPMHESEK